MDDGVYISPLASSHLDP